MTAEVEESMGWFLNPNPLPIVSVTDNTLPPPTSNPQPQFTSMAVVDLTLPSNRASTSSISLDNPSIPLSPLLALEDTSVEDEMSAEEKDMELLEGPNTQGIDEMIRKDGMDMKKTAFSMFNEWLEQQRNGPTGK